MTRTARTPKRRDGWAAEPFDDGCLLHDPLSENVVELNATAAIVWQLCDGTRTLEDIAALISEAFPTAETNVLEDVERTVASLLLGGVLDDVGGHEAPPNLDEP